MGERKTGTTGGKEIKARRRKKGTRKGRDRERKKREE